MPVAFGQAQDLPARQSEPLSRPNRRQIAIDHGLYHLEADLRWIDHTAARLDVLAGEVKR